MANSEHRYRGGDIAVIGMACLFPGADGLHQFWSNIRRKQLQIRDPQPDWGAKRYLNASGATHIATAAGGYLGELYRFDPAELAVMPNSVDGGEPDQFLALKIARDALADAGCLDNYDHTNTGYRARAQHLSAPRQWRHGAARGGGRSNRAAYCGNYFPMQRLLRSKSCAPRWWRNCRRSIPTPRQASCPML